MNKEEKASKSMDINPETRPESISDGENQGVTANSMALMGRLSPPLTENAYQHSQP